MKSALVFSPFAKPFVPLGIAHIKSYVEAGSNAKAKCFDLNLKYYKAIVDSVRTDSPNVRFFPENQRAGFLKTMDLFEAKDDSMFNQDEFDRAGIYFTNCFKAFNDFFQKACAESLQYKKRLPFFMPDFINILLAYRPDFVGFSVSYIEQFYASALIAKLLKEICKNIRVVFGGNSATLMYKDCLSLPFIDYVVMNEGEQAFSELIKSIENNSDIADVPNLAYRKNSELKTTEPSFIKNLNDIPYPDFSDFDLGHYFKPVPVVPILGSRGCYWRRCTFCVHHKSYFLKYRQTSAERLVDELQFHVNNGIRYFSFVDEMISASRFKKIGQEILKRGLEIHYYALAKPTKDFTGDILRTMYESGCRYILWGVESGCQRVLDLIDKGTEVKDMSNVLSCSSSAGIKNHVFIIIGFPSETKEELKETLDFLYNNKDSVHAVHDGSFGLERGSLVFKDPKQFGITKILEQKTQGFSANTLTYSVSRGIRPGEAKRYKAFYGEHYFQHFSFFSISLTSLRDHALIIYSNLDRLVLNKPVKNVPLIKRIDF